MKCGKELWDVQPNKKYARKNYLCRMCLVDIDRIPGEAEKSSSLAESILSKIVGGVFFFKLTNEVIYEPYIVDFVVSHAIVKIGIEIDGSVHEKQQSYDERRDEILLTKYGLPVYRFANEDVNTDRFIKSVWAICYQIYKTRIEQVDAIAGKYNIKRFTEGGRHADFVKAHIADDAFKSMRG